METPTQIRKETWREPGKLPESAFDRTFHRLVHLYDRFYAAGMLLYKELSDQDGPATCLVISTESEGRRMDCR